MLPDRHEEESDSVGLAVPTLPPNSHSSPQWLSSTQSSFLQRLHNVEAWLAAFTGTILSFVFICLLMSLAGSLAQGAPVPELAYTILVILPGVVFEGPFLIRLWCATVNGDRPIGPAVARTVSTSNTLFRLCAIGWWLAHVATSMLFVVALEIQLILKAANAPFLGPIFLGILVFGISICCNVFIAILVKSLFAKDSAVELFWRWRLMVDTCLTASALWIAA